ncbi:transporter substrate-binding domain-containing protein [Alkalimonas amylolytica]|uniref:Solute-binding protein family 3/N-terminal domain-containing protein n=1 Tax=Alkalimonas amylolytica TaxID=152573 RepID=A0A1H4EI81_ALKAM|nr:transporter substrate-binding domain-containing protein [Alkalimonas amylolytica]SEA84733.1 conserved hypothetical protein [Alkalimonas amylolytica]
MLRRCIYPMLWLYILSNSGPLAAHADDKPADTLVIIDVVDWLSPAHQATHQASVLQKILANLTIPHQIQQITRNRARMLVREHPTACMPWLLKTPERLQDFQFSVPYMAENALQLVVRDNTPLAQTLHQQRQAGPVRLGELLLQRRPPILGIETNRSYGQKTDQLLSELQHLPAIYTRTSSSNNPAELIPMLQRGFLDIIIEYEIVAKEHSNELAFFPFEETEAFQLSHFACSNTEDMARLLPALNQSIQMLGQDEEFQQLMLLSIPEHFKQQALQYLREAQQKP